MEEESQQGFLDAWGKERGKLWVCFWGGGRGRERERKREKERERESFFLVFHVFFLVFYFRHYGTTF